MTRASFAPIDIALIAAYFAVTLVVGFWRRRRGTHDYLIANRSLGLPVFVATLVATWYGGILAVGEYTYSYGLVNWTTLGLPYYVFAILFALILAPRIRAASLYTIPDKLAAEYDRKTALLGAAFAFIMVTPAPYILMVGQLTSLIFGIPLLPAMLVGTLFSVVYVYFGGFQSDVRINVFQFVLMFAGFAVSLGVLWSTMGGFGWLTERLPKEHLTLTGGQDLGYVLVWFFIALWTLVDPGFHQRCYAAKSPRVAQVGVLVAVICWALFDFLTTTNGLYARAAMPDLKPEEAGLAFPLLGDRFLPPIAKSLFYIAMLATVMSTVVSFTFLAGMTIGRDFVWRLKGDVDEERIPRYTRTGLIAATILAIGICLLIPRAVGQWWAIGTVFVPGLLIPVVTAYFPRWKVTGDFAFATMAAGTGVALACLTIGRIRHGSFALESAQYPFGIQPMYPGLLAASFVYLLGLGVRGRRQDENV